MTTNTKVSADLFEKAKSFIDTPDKWCQGKYVENEKMCSNTALDKANEGAFDHKLVHRAFIKAHRFTADVPQDLRRFSSDLEGTSEVCAINNTLDHEQLMRVFDTAISQAKEVN